MGHCTCSMPAGDPLRFIRQAFTNANLPARSTVPMAVTLRPCLVELREQVDLKVGSVMV